MRNYANPVKNRQEETERRYCNYFTVAKAIVCTRSGRVFQSTRHSYFDYDFTLCEIPCNTFKVPFRSFQLPLSFFIFDSGDVSFNYSFCIPHLLCYYAFQEPRHAQISNKATFWEGLWCQRSRVRARSVFPRTGFYREKAENANEYEVVLQKVYPLVTASVAALTESSSASTESVTAPTVSVAASVTAQFTRT